MSGRMCDDGTYALLQIRLEGSACEGLKMNDNAQRNEINISYVVIKHSILHPKNRGN